MFDEHFFWIASRAAGVAALLFSSVSVGLGLAMATKFLKGRGPDLRVTHEALSLATIVAIVVHAVVLLGDNFLAPSLAEITVPFVSDYKEPWNTIGIFSGWLMVIFGLTYYVRDRIGQKRWRSLHRFVSIAWLMAIAHSLGEGTDAGTTWFVIGTGVFVAPMVVALALRWLRPDAPSGARA